ncbi:uncharacterized protein LOC121837866 [Ixodes scapularis]|uniref:uncharacterized protein LOC121837866 n=1 Tax=Ixodes scapularis TaxID=6945 RepID=UPI001C37FF2F|nr:uncharacterized protein LOC121837866 [Ixodes scapularis]
MANANTTDCIVCFTLGVSEEAASASHEDTVSAQLAAISQKLELLHTLKANVDRLCDLPAKVDDLLLLKPSVDAMKVTISSLQDSVRKCESMMKLVQQNDQEVKLLRSEVGALQATVSNQTSMIEQLQTNLNSTEQYSRRCNMEIHGIPITDDEDVKVVIEDLAEKLNIGRHHPAEVVACHRLRSRREGAAPILVQFYSTSVKEKWMSARKKLATLPRVCGAHADTINLYIHLCLLLDKNIADSFRAQGLHMPVIDTL